LQDDTPAAGFDVYDYPRDDDAQTARRHRNIHFMN
jgi:hypothetical protein